MEMLFYRQLNVSKNNVQNRLAFCCISEKITMFILANARNNVPNGETSQLIRIPFDS